MRENSVMVGLQDRLVRKFSMICGLEGACVQVFEYLQFPLRSCVFMKNGTRLVALF